MNLIEIITLCIMMFSFFEGIKKGFVRTTVQLIINLVLFILSIYLTPYIFSFFFVTLFKSGGEAFTYLLTIIILYFAFRVLVKIVLKALDLITKLPIIKTLNKTLGCFVGILKGIITVWMLFIILSVISQNEFVASMLQDISGNSILTYLYSNNLIADLLSQVSIINNM